MDCPNPVADVRHGQRGSLTGGLSDRVTGKPVWTPYRTSLVLGALPTAASCARLHAQLVILEWGLLVDTDVVQLLVSELVTNSFKAAETLQETPPIGFRLSADNGLLLIEVWDGDTAPPLPPNLAGEAPAPDAEGGRGLFIVETLSDRWGWYPTRTPAGKVTWCEVHIALPQEDSVMKTPPLPRSSHCSSPTPSGHISSRQPGIPTAP